MKFLPVVERELRAASRRPTTYRFRFLAALAAVLICGWVLLVTGHLPPASLGKQVFFANAAIFWVVALSAGAIYTADCLSEEKREGTLGLLFLTDLTGYDVVGAKLVASSIPAAYGLVSVVPILAIPILLGSVSLAEFVRVVLVLLNTLFSSLCVGVWVSSLTSRASTALGVTSGIVLFVNVFWPLIGIWGSSALGLSSTPPLFLVPSGAYALNLASDHRFLGQDGYFVTSLAINHFGGWLLLFLACVNVRHGWQDSANDEGLSWWTRWKASGREKQGVSHRTEERAQRLDENPFLWLSMRRRSRLRVMQIALGLVFGIWCIGWLDGGDDWLDPILSLVFAFVFHLILKLWVAFEAGERLGSDRRSGVLELVLTTPVSIHRLMRGQILGIRRMGQGTVFVILLFNLLFWIAGLREASWKTGDWLPVCLAVTGTFLLDMHALVWTGLWTGLTARRQVMAPFSAVIRVLVLPWIVWTVLLITPGLRRIDTGWTVFYAWTIVMVGHSLFWWYYSRYRLYRDLRALAAQPIAGKANR